MLKELIKQLASTGDEIYAKICEVISVDDTNQTADLKPLDGSSNINDVYLTTNNKKGGMYIKPVVGSLVCVVFVSKEIGVVVNTSELEELNVKIKGTEFKIDKDGFLLKKENETLKALMSDLIKAIKAMKFTTNTGSTISLVNITDFINLETRFNQFLKED